MKPSPHHRYRSLRTLPGRILVLLVALGGLACFHFAPPPPLVIAHQANPDPFTGVRAYQLAPFTFEGFTYEGRTEAAWQATRSPTQQAAWAQDKANATAYILERLPRWLHPDERIQPLTGPPAPGQFVLAINIDAWVDDGCRATLRIRDASGRTLDEVGIPAETVHTRYGFWDAFRVCLINSTTRSVTYLRSRY